MSSINRSWQQSPDAQEVHFAASFICKINAKRGENLSVCVLVLFEHFQHILTIHTFPTVSSLEEMLLCSSLSFL